MSRQAKPPPGYPKLHTCLLCGNDHWMDGPWNHVCTTCNVKNDANPLPANRAAAGSPVCFGEPTPPDASQENWR